MSLTIFEFVLVVIKPIQFRSFVKIKVQYFSFPTDIKVLHECSGIPFLCDLLHRFECPCLFTLQHQSRVPEFFKTLKEWQRVDEEVVGSRGYKYTSARH